jgi:hypothetical protein
MNNIGRRLSEYIDDLPEHLKHDVEKNFGRDELASKICKVLAERLDGIGTIDEILIALVKFEQVGPELKSRRYLLNKLYRMSESEKVLEPYLDEDGNRKKGTYRLTAHLQQKAQQPQAQPQETQPQEVQPQEVQPQEVQPQETQPQEAQPQPQQPTTNSEPTYSQHPESYKPQAVHWKLQPLKKL